MHVGKQTNKQAVPWGCSVLDWWCGDDGGRGQRVEGQASAVQHTHLDRSLGLQARQPFKLCSCGELLTGPVGGRDPLVRFSTYHSPTGEDLYIPCNCDPVVWRLRSGLAVGAWLPVDLQYCFTGGGRSTVPLIDSVTCQLASHLIFPPTT